MTVASILAEKGKDVFSLGAGTLLTEILQELATRGIGAVLIINDDQSIAGIVSERDIVRALARKGAGILEEPARNHMTSDVVTCSEDDPITVVMEKMTRGRFRHLPVIKDGKLIGVVSIGDVVKRRIEQAEREAEEMRSYISTV